MKDENIKKILDNEKNRQKEFINLIASENYVSSEVLETLGTEFTNKYGEGYPGKRYYRGCKFVDEIESLCMDRALETFRLHSHDWDVNVQPLSGSPANFIVYNALLKEGDVLMGLDLSHGGHLTHGSKFSATAKFWKSVSYLTDKETGLIDFKDLEQKAKKEKPAIIVCGFTAYSRNVDWEKFRKIADEVGALLVADISHISGLVAAGVHPSPFFCADVVTTTTHKTLRGPRHAMIFSKKDERNLHEKINKSVIPGLQGGPHFNTIAAVAVALKEAQTDEFKRYINDVVANANIMARTLKNLGWKIITDGTDTHLFLVDVGEKKGREMADKLEKKGIIVNENTIPFDLGGPLNPSGIRVGSAAETTKQKTREEFIEIAEKMDKIMKGQLQ